MVKKLLNKTFGKWFYSQIRYWVLLKKNRYCEFYYKNKCIGCPYYTDIESKTNCLAIDVWQGLLKIEKILP